MYVSAGGKGIHRPLANNVGKGKFNKQSKNSKNDTEGFKNKNKGKKNSGSVRPFSYTAFKNYGDSNKKKRKRN